MFSSCCCSRVAKTAKNRTRLWGDVGRSPVIVLLLLFLLLLPPQVAAPRGPRLTAGTPRRRGCKTAARGDTRKHKAETGDRMQASISGYEYVCLSVCVSVNESPSHYICLSIRLCENVFVYLRVTLKIYPLSICLPKQICLPTNRPVYRTLCL